jgi:hypothetical protein
VHFTLDQLIQALFSVKNNMFVWLVADGWCWFVLREEYCCLVAGGCFIMREKYCWLVGDKPSEQGESGELLRGAAKE